MEFPNGNPSYYPRPGYVQPPPGTAYPPPPSQYYPGPPAGVIPSGVIPAELAGRPTFKVHCKANPNFALAVLGEKVVLAYANPSDPYQHWYKDEKYGSWVKDEEGSPAFALVNQATGLALKHSIGKSYPVQAIPYPTGRTDESVLWTLSREFGHGFRTIRMVNNIHLNMDVFHGDRKSGGVHDGMSIVLWDWNQGDNQLWKITPYFE